MNFQFWASEETQVLKEYEFDFPLYSQWSSIGDYSSDECFIKTSFLEQAGMGIRVERIKIIKHEDFGDGEIKWTIESEELIWFNKMVLKDNIEYILGLGNYKLSESRWREIVIELKNFIKDII